MDIRAYMIECINVRFLKVPKAAIFAVSFFVAMIIHELALEAASNVQKQF
jgi:hypothetical protein